MTPPRPGLAPAGRRHGSGPEQFKWRWPRSIVDRGGGVHGVVGGVGLAPEQFARAFPFHLVLDSSGRLIQAGHVLRRLCPALAPGTPVGDVVSLMRPGIPFTFAALAEHEESLFILRVGQPVLTLRGQVIVDTRRGLALFLGSPWLTRMGEAAALGLSLSDFANHDAAAEFLLLFQTKDMARADAEALADRLANNRDQLKAANAQLEATERDLRETNAELARVARLKNEFLSSMSHELRTPLNAILGMSESLLEGVYGPVGDRQRKALDLVESSGRHLLALINEVLDLSRIEAGRLALEMAAVDVVSVCEAALAMVRPAASKKTLSLRTSFAPDVTTIDADERRLKQILVNLLSNAVKFTPDHGSVTLAVAADAAAGTVSFAVTDTGIGIAPDDLPRLFTPFCQLDAGLSRQHGGTGLGLVLSRRMTELHHGRIDVASTPGRGSTFTVTMPWRSTEFHAVPDRLGEAAAPEAVDHRDRRVMIVDDNPSNQSVLADFLAARSFVVTTAVSALDAVEMARQDPPDIILMDVQLPGLDGLAATALIRQDPVLRAVPIIAVTGLAMPGDRERCLAAGMDDYLSKPVKLTALESLIDGLLTRAATESAR